MLGDVLIRRFKELKTTTERWGNNPLYKKIKEIALEELFSMHPEKIKSDDITKKYREIFKQNERKLPSFCKLVLNSNGQKSYEVMIRNLFCTNKSLKKHPKAFANLEEVLYTTEPHGRGQRFIYEANTAYYGIYGKDKSFYDVTTSTDGVSVLSVGSSPSSEELIEEIEDKIEQTKIRKAKTLTDEELAEEDKKAVNFSKKGSTSKRVHTNPAVAKTVLSKANFTCLLDDPQTHTHKTFQTNDNHEYVEAHHLIPMKFQLENGPKIDVSANIVPLCPTCHRAVHNGDVAVKKAYLKKIYDIKKGDLIRARLLDKNSTFDQFFSDYYNS